MQSVPVHQAKNNFSALLHAVETGEEVFITRHGKRLAQLVYVPQVEADPDALARLDQEALSLLEHMRDKVLPGPALDDWQALRDAGRRV